MALNEHPSEPIHSLQNKRVKAAIKLRERRERMKQGRFVIDGHRELAHAVAAGLQLVELFCCREALSASAEQLLPAITRTDAEVLEVTTAVWEKLNFGNRNDGLLAVAESFDTGLDEILTPSSSTQPPSLSQPPFIVVLEAVEKPGNLGAVLRTADAAGVTGVIVADGVTDVFNPNVIRASLGTIFRMPVVCCTAEEAKSWLSAQGIRPLVTRVDATEVYTKADLTIPLAIVLGSEAHGVTQVWQSSDCHGVRLPMHGSADSLNVSTSAAIVMYEVVRQRAG